MDAIVFRILFSGVFPNRSAQLWERHENEASCLLQASAAISRWAFDSQTREHYHSFHPNSFQISSSKCQHIQIKTRGPQSANFYHSLTSHHISGVACVHTEQFNSNHPVLSQISTEPETLSMLQVIISLLLSGIKKRRRAAFHRIFFFLIIPQGIQLQQCLEISEITVFLRGKKTIRTYLISSFSRRHVLVMRFHVSPASPCFPLSSYLHLSHLSSPIFHFPILP